MQRHYGLDWLRIGAFALLILYHVGMFFVPWDWHVKTARPADWVAIPMLATNAWRLPLLFLVSGYASRVLIAKSNGTGRFARERSWRLLVPLLFAMAVVVPPQPWVELVFKHGYVRDFWAFYGSDYFAFAPIEGLVVPTWQHLWFVAYLWVYTMLLAATAKLAPAGIQAWFDRAFGGWRLLALPIAWLILVRVVLLPGVGETHDLFTDPAAHAVYLPAFLFGFGLGGTGALWPSIRRLWKPAAAMALIGFAALAAVELRWPGDTRAPDAALLLFRAARALQAWGAIIALLWVADRFWNRDHPWRATLTQAVFPFYIIHQTIIVLLGWWLLRFGLPPLAEFAILITATAAGCWLFYDVGRRIRWLRPLIGLKRGASAGGPPGADEPPPDRGSVAPAPAPTPAAAGGARSHQQQQQGARDDDR